LAGSLNPITQNKQLINSLIKNLDTILTQSA